MSATAGLQPSDVTRWQKQQLFLPLSMLDLQMTNHR